MNWRDKNFRYIPSKDQGEGYLKRRFAKIRAEQRAKAEQEQADKAEAEAKVKTLKRKT